MSNPSPAKTATTADKKSHQAQPNRLLALPEKKKESLFFLLRQCRPGDPSIEAKTGLKDVTKREIDRFFRLYAEEHWTKRIERAAQEADAMIRLVQKNPVEFSDGVLAALGQEVFRRIASGTVEPGVLAQFIQLFSRASSEQRAKQTLEMKREKHESDLRTRMERALDSLAEDLGTDTQARAAFEELKRVLNGEHDEEGA